MDKNGHGGHQEWSRIFSIRSAHLAKELSMAMSYVLVHKYNTVGHTKVAIERVGILEQNCRIKRSGAA